MLYRVTSDKALIEMFSVIFLAHFGLCTISYKSTVELYTKASDCIYKILVNEFSFKSLVFLKEEVQEDNHIRRILKISWDRMIVSSRNVSIATGVFTFLPDNNSTVSYDKILRAKQGDYNSKYIICTNNMRNVLNLFEEAWKYKVLDVIALVPSSVRQVVSVYTYLPYGPFGCSSTDPVRINIYEPDINGFQHRGRLFSKTRKLWNHHRCPVRVTVSDRRAEEILDGNTNSNGGVPIALYLFLQKRLNFTSNVALIDRETNTYAAAYYNFTSAVVLSIANGNSDVGVGRFSQLVDYHKDVDSPCQTSMDCFTWGVPLKAGRSPSVWTTSVYEFDLVCWVLITTSALFAVYVLRFIRDVTPSSDKQDGFTVFATLLSSSTDMRAASNPMRAFLGCWLLYCFVMSAAYSASLGSLVTVPPDSSDIETSKELLEKNFLLTGSPKMYHILSASSETSSQIKNILDRFNILVPGEFKTIINKIYTSRNVAVFYTKSKLIQEENRVRAEMKLGSMVHIIPKCLITSHTSPLIMKKGSVLMEPAKIISIRLLESGILHYWDGDEEEEIALNITNVPQKFTISQLRGALIVTIIGFIISTAVFIYEILSTKFQSLI